jgi:antitoxin component YwqK of YwqJK toxin-antitoxin module
MTGEYINGMENGDFTLYYEKRRHKTSGHIYKTALKKAPYRLFTNQAKLKVEGEYLNGQEHGIYKLYYKSGKMKINGAYNNGKQEGLYKMYYPPDSSG